MLLAAKGVGVCVTFGERVYVSFCFSFFFVFCMYGRSLS